MSRAATPSLSPVDATVPTPASARPRQRSARQRIVARFLRARLAPLGAGIVLLIALIALAAPLIVPYDPVATNPLSALEAPSAGAPDGHRQHWARHPVADHLRVAGVSPGRRDRGRYRAGGWYRDRARGRVRWRLGGQPRDAGDGRAPGVPGADPGAGDHRRARARLEQRDDRHRGRLRPDVRAADPSAGAGGSAARLCRGGAGARRHRRVASLCATSSPTRWRRSRSRRR